MIGKDVPSEVSRQPVGYEETREGAMNRAMNVFTKDVLFSFGLESGLIEGKHTRTGYVLQCVGIIYDGKGIYEGMSSAYELPKELVQLVLKENLSVNQAYVRLSEENSPTFRVVQSLTKVGDSRKKFMMEAVRATIRTYLSTSD